MVADKIRHYHENFMEIKPGVWSPAIPIETKGALGRTLRRDCKKHGGHFWHPTGDQKKKWGCCRCGARTKKDLPKDGT